MYLLFQNAGYFSESSDSQINLISHKPGNLILYITLFSLAIGKLCLTN